MAYERHQGLVRQLLSAQVIRVPGALAFDEAHGAAFIDALPGRKPAFSGPGAAGDAQLCAAALDDLRRLGPRNGPEWTTDQEISGLEQWRELINLYRPVAGPGVQAAFDEAVQDLRALPPVDAAACHRDFHEAQILLNAGACGVLDFDTLCTADPALDIGNFAAHVQFAEWRGGADARSFSDKFQACASLGLGADAPSRVAVWRRAALLRLAAIYSFTSEPGDVVARLVAGARR